MSDGKALGFIETVGLAAAIAAADAALKAANVKLIGRENSRGQGCITIKIIGDVGAVKAAIDAAKTVAGSVSRVWATDIIPRPAEGIGELMAWNGETNPDFLKTDHEAKTPPDNQEEQKEEQNEEQKQEQQFEEQNAQVVQLDEIAQSEQSDEAEQEAEQEPEIEQEAEQEPEQGTEENEQADASDQAGPEKQQEEARPKPGKRGKNSKKHG
jgi:microcompartment protein CcmL/EutN